MGRGRRVWEGVCYAYIHGVRGWLKLVTVLALRMQFLIGQNLRLI